MRAKMFKFALLSGVVALIVVSWPDIARYLTIRSM